MKTNKTIFPFVTSTTSMKSIQYKQLMCKVENKWANKRDYKQL